MVLAISLHERPVVPGFPQIAEQVVRTVVALVVDSLDFFSTFFFWYHVLDKKLLNKLRQLLLGVLG
jgi:hypothetical protein